jgi:ribonuclease HI
MTTNNTFGRSLVLAIDGACLGNPGPGGWAIIIHEKTNGLIVGQSAKAGCHSSSTNRPEAELTAAIEALTYALTVGAETVTVVTSSQYVQKGMTEWLTKWEQNGWRNSDGKAVKNRDHWLALSALAKQLTVEWQWVKAHTDHMVVQANAVARDAACGLFPTEERLRYFHPNLFTETR